MRTQEIEGCVKAIDAALGFDKINLRAAHPLNLQHLTFLKANSASVNLVESRYPYHHDNHRYSRLMYAIVAPNQKAMRLIDNLPKGQFTINYVEPAIDMIVDEETKWALLQLFDRCFVHPKHRQSVKHFSNGGTVTGQRRFWFAWYADRRSKITGARHCFHLEARCQGRQVLHQIGFENLLTFDLAAFWLRYLDNIYEVDLQRLGRYHLNRTNGTRRQHALVHRAGSFSYDVDRAVGCIIYNWARYAAVKKDDQDKPRSAQHLVDFYGREQFLRKIDLSGTLFIVNVKNPSLLSEVTDFVVADRI
jgi:hypothetical protein